MDQRSLVSAPIHAVVPIELPGPPRRVYPLIETAQFESGVEVVDAGSEVPWHFHSDATEHFYFESGHAIIFMQPPEDPENQVWGPETSYQVGPGSAALVSPLTRSVIWITPEYICSKLDFSFQFFVLFRFRWDCRHRIVNLSDTEPLKFLYLFNPAPTGGFAKKARQNNTPNKNQ